MRSNSEGDAADNIRFCNEGLFTKCGANIIIATTTRSIPILLIADLRAMECRSPAAPPTVCDFGIEGVDGLGAVEADVVLGSAEADRGCAGFLGGMAGCRSFSR